MKNNSIVTYDEIVDALKSIIECSINNDYEDDFDYLNVKYESSIDGRVDAKDDSILYHSLKELEKSIDESSKIIRKALEEQLINDSIIKINSEYILGYENRVLSASMASIDKLKEASLDLNILNDVPSLLPTALDKLNEVDTNKVFSDFEVSVINKFPEYFDSDIPIENVTYDIVEEKDYEKIEMINKALKKAKQLGDKELIDKLQKMYDDEIN